MAIALKIYCSLVSTRWWIDRVVWSPVSLDLDCATLDPFSAQGGEILDKAQRQEAELRQAQHELEHRRDQETSLVSMYNIGPSVIKLTLGTEYRPGVGQTPSRIPARLCQGVDWHGLICLE